MQKYLVALVCIVVSEAKALTDDAHLLFSNAGKLYVQTSSQRVEIRVQLWHFQAACAAMRASVGKLNKQHPTLPTACKLASLQHVETACMEVDSWPHMFDDADPTSTDTTHEEASRSLNITVSRPKRQLLGIFGAVLGFVGIGAAAADAFAVHAVANRVERLGAELRNVKQSLKAIEDATSKSLHRLDGELHCLQLQQFIAAGAARIASVNEALTELISAQRITPALLPVTELATLWPRVLLNIKQHGHVRGESFPPHIVYELPTSYTVWGAQLRITFDVPLISKRFRLLSRASYPISTPLGPFTALGVEHAIIAVDDSSTEHVAVSEAHLATCNRLHRHFFCEGEGWHSQLHSSCIGAMYLGDAGAIARRCHLVRFREAAAFARIDDSRLAVFTEVSTAATVSCVNGSRWSRLLPSNFSIQLLPRTCGLVADTFTVPPHINRDLDAGVVAIAAWGDMDAAVFGDAADVFDHAMRKVANMRVSSTTSASPWSTWLHGAATTGVVLAALAVCSVCCALYRRYQRLAVQLPKS